jgi:hypothetical protein
MPGQRSAAIAALLVGVIVSGGCSVQDGPTGQRAPSPTAAPTIPTSSAEPPPTTAAPVSSAVIEIGPARYELDAVCAAGGASEVEVAVTGLDVNAKPVIGLIRAFEAEPYIGLQVGDAGEAVLFEPRLEGVLPFELDGDVLEFPEVDFVTELDLATGEFVAAGVGSVTVECLTFVRELPAVSFD